MDLVSRVVVNAISALETQGSKKTYFFTSRLRYDLGPTLTFSSELATSSDPPSENSPSRAAMALAGHTCDLSECLY